jgi:outer membrane biosynthesis protein TonB
MKSRRNGRAWELAALFAALLLGCCVPARARNAAAADSAICPIVYQVDEGIPSPHGYRYLFFGNGFFINKDGYVLTAAHVLGQLQGGQPFLLLHDNAGQVEFVKADVSALDPDHDIAVLHAEQNPFDGKHAVSFLPLDAADARPGEMVRAASFMPSEPRDAFSLDPIREEQSPGKVIRFEFSQLDKGAAQTELFLFNHDIHPGQSGSPVISEESHGVAGLVEGQWLRDNSAVLAELSVRKTGDGPPLARGIASVPGAVVPIHYALPLLQQKGIAWQAAPASTDTRGDEAEDSVASSDSFGGPTPLSLVAAPYPASLFGGEVLLDAAVNRNGTLSDVKVISGEQPFVKQALDAARTWTFVPQSSEHAGETRIAIAFQFPQPYVPPRRPTVQHFDPDSSGSTLERAAQDRSRNDASAFVLTSYEPDYPAASNADGSVILYESIDRDGHITSVRALTGAEPLRSAALAAANEWQFAPAKRNGNAVDSAAIVVVTFRQPLSGVPAAARCAMKMCGEKACVVCAAADDATQKKN